MIYPVERALCNRELTFSSCQNNAVVKVAKVMCRNAETTELKARRKQFYTRFAFKFLFPQFTSSSFYVSFLLPVKINSTNWPAPNVRVFIDQLVEHCSATAEAMGSNPVEVPKCFRVNRKVWRQVTMVAKFLDDNNRAEIKQRRRRQ